MFGLHVCEVPSRSSRSFCRICSSAASLTHAQRWSKRSLPTTSDRFACSLAIWKVCLKSHSWFRGWSDFILSIKSYGGSPLSHVDLLQWQAWLEIAYCLFREYCRLERCWFQYRMKFAPLSMQTLSTYIGNDKLEILPLISKSVFDRFASLHVNRNAVVDVCCTFKRGTCCGECLECTGWFCRSSFLWESQALQSLLRCCSIALSSWVRLFISCARTFTFFTNTTLLGRGCAKRFPSLLLQSSTAAIKSITTSRSYPVFRYIMCKPFDCSQWSKL